LIISDRGRGAAGDSITRGPKPVLYKGLSLVSGMAVRLTPQSD
jgi:hypothetical protein